MIKTKEGKTEIKGDKSGLMADLTVILKELSNKHGLSERDIDFCVKTSRKSVDEIAPLAILGMLGGFLDEGAMKKEEENE